MNREKRVPGPQKGHPLLVQGLGQQEARGKLHSSLRRHTCLPLGPLICLVQKEGGPGEEELVPRIGREEHSPGQRNHSECDEWHTHTGLHKSHVCPEEGDVHANRYIHIT